MPPLYKEGVYWLVLAAVTATAYLILAVFIGPDPAQGVFGLLGLGGFQPLLYRKRGQEVVWDERDTLINLRAVVAGYSVFWLVFTLGTMGLWAAVYYGGHSTVSVHVLPRLLMGGFLVFVLTRAVAIVVQYRRHNADKGE